MADGRSRSWYRPRTPLHHVGNGHQGNGDHRRVRMMLELIFELIEGPLEEEYVEELVGTLPLGEDGHAGRRREVRPQEGCRCPGRPLTRPLERSPGVSLTNARRVEHHFRRCEVERPHHRHEITQRRPLSTAYCRRLSQPRLFRRSTRAGQHEILPSVEYMAEMKISVRTHAHRTRFRLQEYFTRLEDLSFPGQHDLRL